MDDKERIAQDRRNRFSFLRHLYDVDRTAPAGVIRMPKAQDAGAAIGVSGDEGVKIAEFLKGQGLAKFMTMGPTVRITHAGIEYIEQALAEPDEPTSLFPPVNVMMFTGDVHGSQIQQGTTHSSQEMTLSPEARQQVLTALDLARIRVQDVTDVDSRDDLVASIDTAAAQIRRRSPSRAIVAEALKSLSTVAEKVGIGIAVAEILKLATLYGLM